MPKWKNCICLTGQLMIGDRKLYPGDYNRAEPDSADYRVWSETGCTCVLRIRAAPAENLGRKSAKIADLHDEAG